MMRLGGVAIACLLLLADCRTAGPTARPPEHRNAPKAWEYDFDRNALAASVQVGSSIIALAEAGHVLRFDLQTLRLTGERLSRRRAIVLGAATATDVLVGFTNGRIARLDASTLIATPIAAVEGHPVWIGTCPGIASPLVVYASPVAAPYPASHPRGLVGYRARLLATEEEVEIDTGTTFLCDSKGRLWIGADRGEWGGALQVVDLRARPLAVRKVSYEKSELNGIYGLVESPKGDILAFGGTLHMGFGSAQLTKFSPSGSSQEIYAAKFNGWTTQPVTPNPTLPITQALSKEGRWLVFSYDAAFECDGAFRNWKRIATLHVRTNPGRPDAVASYPGIVRVDDVGGRILLTTHLDGLLELRRGEIVRHTLPDQLDVAPDTVILWRDGLAARDREGDLAVRLDGRWQQPFANLPPLRHRNESDGSYAHGSYLPLPDGRALIVATPQDDSDAVDGRKEKALPFVSAFVERDSVAVAAEQNAELPTASFDTAFLLPSGKPAMSGPDDRLWIYASGRWSVAEPPRHLRAVRKWVARQSVSWLGLATGFFPDDPLVWVDLESPAPAKAVPFAVRIDGQPVDVDDGIPWDARRSLLATDPRLCLVDLSTGDCAPVDQGIPNEARRVARDGKGRVWAAGRGLWRLDPERGPVPYPVNLPFLEDANVLDLEAVEGRLVLTLGNRGLAMLDADAPGGEFDEPVLDPWNSRQPHEPRFEDGAVFVYLDETLDSSPDWVITMRKFYALQEKLRAEIRPSGIRGYLAWDLDTPIRKSPRPIRFTLYTSDVDALARHVFRLTQADPLASKLRVMIRRGPRGRAPIVRWPTEPGLRRPGERP